MAWVKLDDKHIESQAPRGGLCCALCLDEGAAICWSAHEETDGFISDADLDMLANLHGCKKVQPLVDALLKENRWTRWENPVAATTLSTI